MHIETQPATIHQNMLEKGKERNFSKMTALFSRSTKNHFLNKTNVLEEKNYLIVIVNLFIICFQRIYL